MSRIYKVKCQLCGNETTTDKAFRVKKGSRNLYYCSEEEYKKYQDQIDKKNKCYESIIRIMQVPMLSPVMIKEINKIANYYDYIVIEKCFNEQEQKIKWFLNNNEFSNEYGKARYIATIIQNNINNTYKKHMMTIKQMEKLFEKDKENIDIEIINITPNNEKRNKVNDISEFLS